MQRQPVLVSAVLTSDFHILCNLLGFWNALEAVADLEVAGLVGFFDLVWVLFFTFLSQLHRSGSACFLTVVWLQMRTL